ncbi:MAG TPA: hypothetical protein PLW86_16760 [Rhodocyclaceae bacterium]|nr:hypothetical protein [Rhodocyclaceae bacterium]
MKSAIIINLDYENHSIATCSRIWEEIERSMQQAGFSKHKRLFVTAMDWNTASKQAKSVMAAVENNLSSEGILVFDVIKELYCFEYQQMNDLLDPVNHTPEVSFVDTGTFRAFLGKP